YEKFITSLHDIASKDKSKRKAALIYLLKLGAGWIVGIVLCLLLLSKLFETHVYILCSAFIGLTIAAIPFIIKDEIRCIRGKYYNLVFTLLGAALVVGVVLLRKTSLMSAKISFIDGLEPWQYFYVFIAGFVAIAAMILPGISGSTVLLIFGTYVPAVAAAGEAFHLRLSWHMILGLSAMGLGVIVGALVSIKGIKTALEKHRSQTVYCVLGMMLGSLYAISVGPESLKEAKPAMTLAIGTESGLRIVPLLVGAAVLVGLELIKLRTEKKLAAKPDGAGAENAEFSEEAAKEDAVEDALEAEVEEAVETVLEDAISGAGAAEGVFVEAGETFGNVESAAEEAGIFETPGDDEP
ncbi:MAG: DUF368 domain-containing protein, partial [Clostridia bacterium]|nr:DUF368 domain-containing protein [Clostridia bacterium]